MWVHPATDFHRRHVTCLSHKKEERVLLYAVACFRLFLLFNNFWLNRCLSLDSKTLGTAHIALCIAVPFPGKESEGEHRDEGGDKDKDDTDIAIPHAKPWNEPSVFRVADPVVASEDREMIADDAEDDENQTGKPNDGSEDIPEDLFFLKDGFLLGHDR